MYGGPKAASEPETQALSKYLHRHRPRIRIYLTLHSYSQMILHPYGYTTRKPRNYQNLLKLRKIGAEAIKKVRGAIYQVGSPAVLMGATPGGSDDFAFDVAKINYSYTIELPDTGQHGFLLPAGQIEPVFKEVWAGLKAMLRNLR